MSRAALLLIACFAARIALGAAEQQPLKLTACDDLVRPPVLFRAWIQRDVASDEFASGPFILQISLEHGGRMLAGDDIAIARLGQLREGVRVVLAPGELDPLQADAPAVLRVTLANPARTRIERLSREIPTPRGLARELARLTAQLRQRGDTEPLPWLWSEQGAEIVDGGASAARCRMLSELVGLLGAWNAGQHPAAGPVIAYRDPIDGSVQPERRCAPTGTVRNEAWLFRSPERAPTKSTWAAPAAPWLAAASAAGCIVVDWYPAGDLHWEGAALLRAEARLAQRREPVLLVGEGDGALAAARLAAMHPDRVSAMRLVRPRFHGQRLPDRPEGVPVSIIAGDDEARVWAGRTSAIAPPEDAPFWYASTSVSVAAKAATLAQVSPAFADNLAAYATAPFVVVVGLGEHLAAQQDDRALAQAFVAGWAAHAHGLPRVVDDAAYQERDWRGFNLVLIGNARSNRVLTEVARHASLPISWDSRSLTLGGQTWLRSERRPVAFAFPRPDDARRVVVVLDGSPAWKPGTLPLAGLHSPFIGDAPATRDSAP